MTGTYSHRRDYETATVSFDIWVFGGKANEDTLKAAFRKIRQPLTLTLSSTNRVEYSHTGNTGFDSLGDTEKLDKKGTGSNQSCWRCTVVVGLPATPALEEAGRQSAEISVAENSAGIRTIAFTGVYTATPGNSARTNFDNPTTGVIDFIEDQLALIGLSIENVEIDTTDSKINETDKTLKFTIICRELVFDQVGSTQGFDSDEVSEQEINISADAAFPGDSIGNGAPSVVRPRNVVAKWTGLYRGAGVEDGEPSVALVSAIIARLIQLTSERFQPISLVVDRVVPDYTPDTRNLSVTLMMRSFGGNVFEYVRTESANVDTGVVLLPVWLTPFTKYRYQGEARYTLTITETVGALGPPPTGGLIGSSGGVGGIGWGGWSSDQNSNTLPSALNSLRPSGPPVSEVVQMGGGSNPQWALKNITESPVITLQGDPTLGSSIVSTQTRQAIYEAYCEPQ